MAVNCGRTKMAHQLEIGQKLRLFQIMMTFGYEFHQITGPGCSRPEAGIERRIDLRLKSPVRGYGQRLPSPKTALAWCGNAVRSLYGAH